MKKGIFCAMLAFGGMCRGDSFVGWTTRPGKVGTPNDNLYHTQYPQDRPGPTDSLPFGPALPLYQPGPPSYNAPSYDPY